MSSSTSRFDGNSGVGVDIGGSFAKLVYFRPLTPVELPSYVLKEATTLHLKADFHLSINSDQLGGVIRFIRMPVSKVESFADFVHETGVHNLFNFKEKLNVTGGGAFKFEKMLREKLGVSINKLDEMEMLVNGLNFVLDYVNNEVFTYSHETKKQQFVGPNPGDKFPYLLVNIGSGVSILKVNSETEFHRVSGSSIGGGTFWGLACQLTDVTSWDQVQEMSNTGDNRVVDLMVGDIYGSSYDKLGLDSNVIASSFAKAGHARTIAAVNGIEFEQPLDSSSKSSSTGPSKNANDSSTAIHSDASSHQQQQGDGTITLTPNCIAAQLNASVPSSSTSSTSFNNNIINNIDSNDRSMDPKDGLSSSPSVSRNPNAYSTTPPIHSPFSSLPDIHQPWSNADMVKSLLFMICNNIGQVAFLNAKLHQVKRVYFAGGFIQRNPYIWSTLSFAIKFWSKGDMQAMFLHHDGYLGALGALISGK